MTLRVPENRNSAVIMNFISVNSTADALSLTEPLYKQYQPPVKELIPLPKGVLYMLMAALVVLGVAYAIVGHLIKDLAVDIAGVSLTLTLWLRLNELLCAFIPYFQDNVSAMEVQPLPRLTETQLLDAASTSGQIVARAHKRWWPQSVP